MKKTHLLLIFTIIATLAATVSCARKNAPEEKQPQSGRRQVLSNKKDVPDITLEPTQTTYVMRLENTTLTLYELKDGDETVVCAVNIDPSYYPSEDIRELNQGITAYTKEEGFARMENFAN